MKTLVLSPAGHQPVRVASMMAIGSQAKRRNALAKFISKNSKSLLTAASFITGLATYASFLGYYLTDSNGWWLAMAISIMAFLASLYPVFAVKKGETL